jgi:hypothetical protein
MWLGLAERRRLPHHLQFCGFARRGRLLMSSRATHGDSDVKELDKLSLSVGENNLNQSSIWEMHPAILPVLICGFLTFVCADYKLNFILQDAENPDRSTELCVANDGRFREVVQTLTKLIELSRHIFDDKVGMYGLLPKRSSGERLGSSR